jgi:hypothetical protein
LQFRARPFFWDDSLPHGFKCAINFNLNIPKITAKEQIVGRIIAPVEIRNVANANLRIFCNAWVDTDASYMVLPSAWKPKLGDLEVVAQIEVERANQTALQGEICGPVRLQIEGFRHVYSEVLFIDMQPNDGIYEPLIGYIVLEQCQAGVDMLGHRLVHIKRMDLKSSKRASLLSGYRSGTPTFKFCLR